MVLGRLGLREHLAVPPTLERVLTLGSYSRVAVGAVLVGRLAVSLVGVVAELLHLDRTEPQRLALVVILGPVPQFNLAAVGRMADPVVPVVKRNTVAGLVVGPPLAAQIMVYSVGRQSTVAAEVAVELAWALLAQQVPAERGAYQVGWQRQLQQVRLPPELPAGLVLMARLALLVTAEPLAEESVVVAVAAGRLPLPVMAARAVTADSQVVAVLVAAPHLARLAPA